MIPTLNSRFAYIESAKRSRGAPAARARPARLPQRPRAPCPLVHESSTSSDETLLPSSPWAPSLRMFTGTIARRSWRGGSAQRESSSARSVPVAAHSMTSLTLPSRAARILCTSARALRRAARQRRRPTRRRRRGSDGPSRPAPSGRRPDRRKHHLPQRAAAVQTVRVEVRNPVEKVGLVTRRAERCLTDVRADVEALIAATRPTRARRYEVRRASAGSVATGPGTVRGASAASRAWATRRPEGSKTALRRCASTRCHRTAQAQGMWRRAPSADRGRTSRLLGSPCKLR